MEPSLRLHHSYHVNYHIIIIITWVSGARFSSFFCLSCHNFYLPDLEADVSEDGGRLRQRNCPDLLQPLNLTLTVQPESMQPCLIVVCKGDIASHFVMVIIAMMTPKQTEEDMLGKRSHHNSFTPCSVSAHQQTVHVWQLMPITDSLIQKYNQISFCKKNVFLIWIYLHSIGLYNVYCYRKRIGNASFPGLTVLNIIVLESQ